MSFLLFLPVLLAGLALRWCLGLVETPFLRPPLAFGALLILALALDAVLIRYRRDLPLYRRHWGIVLLCLPAAFLAGWKSPATEPLTMTLACLGTAFGLAFPVLGALRGRRLAMFSWIRGSASRPNPTRPLILVADPHWRDELVGLEAAQAAQPEADWLFLGDVFDVWVGLPGMDSAGQRNFLDWVRARRRSGAWVGLWMGNREYFLDGFAGEFDLMGEGTGGRLPSEGLAFEHGDWINPSDWKYRVWNVVSRSGFMWLCFRLLPGFLARRTADALEIRLRTTNRAYKLAFPREAFAQAVEAVEDRIFLTGHFHTLERVGKGLALPWAHEGEFWVFRKGLVEPISPR